MICNPIPEQYEIKKEIIDKEIDAALLKMEKQGIHGKDCTPFLLKTIVELTDGKSLDANIELVLNNARLGAKIATELSLLHNINRGK